MWHSCSHRAQGQLDYIWIVLHTSQHFLLRADEGIFHYWSGISSPLWLFHECVIHNCSSSALCLLILVSLTTVSSLLCLTHHCLLTTVSDSPLCLTHHSVSSPLCLTHQCVSFHSTGAWSSGQNNFTHAYIWDQKGRGKLGTFNLNSPNYQQRTIPQIREAVEHSSVHWATALLEGLPTTQCVSQPSETLNWKSNSTWNFSHPFCHQMICV